MALKNSLDTLPMRYWIFTLIGCSMLTLPYASEEMPLFLKPFYKSRQTYPSQKHLLEPEKIYKKPFDPFAYSFLQVKYLLVSSDLESIYATNHSENQKYPGKFWNGLSVRAQNRLKYQWFKVHNEVLMPEFELYLKTHKGQGSSFIHNRGL